MSDARIGKLAGRQDGVVTRAQLLALGVSGDAIDRRLRSGRLFAVHRGVYAVGHAALSDRGRIRAALLAAGARAIVSHTTAGYLYYLIHALPAVIELTVHGRGGRSRPGLTIHESTRPTEIRRHRGLPLTEPLRTLQDLGFPDRPTREALARRLIRPEDLPGTAPAPTRSTLERRMLKLVGYVVLRFTWRQVCEEPMRVAATIAATLSRGSAARARALS